MGGATTPNSDPNPLVEMTGPNAHLLASTARIILVWVCVELRAHEWKTRTIVTVNFKNGGEHTYGQPNKTEGEQTKNPASFVAWWLAEACG